MIKKEVIVKADTLTASLSLYRAVLSQEKASPFTIKDMTLREKIFELYPQNRPTPFPFLFSPEPKFEKQ